MTTPRTTIAASAAPAGRMAGVLFATLLVAGLPLPAPGSEASDHLNTRQPARPPFLQHTPDEAFRLPDIPDEPPAAGSLEGATVYVKRIAFRGNRALTTAELDAIAAPYAGQHLGEAALEELRQKLTHRYIERGYINSGALFADGALAGETLTIDLIEGRLNAIRLHGMCRLDDSYLIDRLQPDAQAALNIDRLRERFAQLLGDPLFTRLNARLLPGENIGEATLDIDVERARPYRLELLANNHRPPSIGSYGMTLNGSLANLSGHGDLLEASLQTPTRQNGSQGGNLRGSIDWRLPLNQRGTQLTLRYEHGQSSVVEEPMRTLAIKSVLTTQETGLSQTLLDTLQHRLALGLNRVHRENRSTLLGEPFSFVAGEADGVTRIAAWRFWQEYSFRSEKQVLALRSTFSSARNNLLPPDSALPNPSAQPGHRYALWLGQGQWARQLMDNGAQVTLRASVQQSAQRLLALDRLSMGGNSTVRGYRENQLLRERGVIINAEFDYPLLKAADPGLNLSLVPFYDYGRGRNRDEAAETLSSIGLATRLRWQGFSLDLAIAKRLQHPESISRAGGTLQDKGVHVQLSYRFY